MRLPFLSHDGVRAGLFCSAGAWTDRPGPVPAADQAFETFLRIVEQVAGLGVSCIVEYVCRRARPSDLSRLEAAADLVVLQTECSDPLDRLTHRTRNDRLMNRQPVLDSLGLLTIDEHASAVVERMRSVVEDMQTEFDLPLLRVETDEGYSPGLDSIIGWRGLPRRTPNPGNRRLLAP